MAEEKQYNTTASEKLDYSNLEKQLETLTGYDFEAAENEERMAGNPIADITLATGFLARLAAKAMGVPVSRVKEMRANDYKTVTATVSNFLFGNLAEMAKARLENSGKSQ